VRPLAGQPAAPALLGRLRLVAASYDNRKNEVALRRFAGVSFIEQKLREGFGIVEALRLAALRPWPDENGYYYAARTLEGTPGKAEALLPCSPKAEPMRGLFVKFRTKSVNGSLAR
jgi:hypothetical protein